MSDHLGQSGRWTPAELARREIEVGIEPTHCPECGLPLPGPHRGMCSVSLMHGGFGYGLPLEACDAYNPLPGEPDEPY